MGILNNEYYYYFKTRNGITNIVRWGVRINTSINKNYLELTPEQVQFYLEHPEASVEEVRKCQLNIAADDTPELYELKSDAKRSVRSSYIDKMNEHKDIEIALAVASRICIQNLWLTQSNCAYSTDEAKEKIKAFVVLGKAANDILAQALSDIDSAETESAINDVSNKYKARLEELNAKRI